MSMLGVMVVFAVFVCRWIDEVVVGGILQVFGLILEITISCCFDVVTIPLGLFTIIT